MQDLLLQQLEREKNELIAKIEELEKSIKTEEGVHIEIKQNKGKYIQYYKCKNVACGRNGARKRVRNYIKQNEIELARTIAQDEYSRQLIDDMKRRCKMLQPLIDYYYSNPKDSIYKSLGATRKALITSEYEPDELYIKRWMEMYSKADEYDPFYEKYPITKPYYTERGEKVRSKSEKIIADKLFREGIPYVYEPLIIIEGKRLHPDFVILNIKQRKTYIYEHFGIMDNPEYATQFVNKISMYDRMGFEYSNNLLYTFETQADGLDTKLLDKIICKYFL